MSNPLPAPSERGSPLTTPYHGWHELRAPAAEDAAADYVTASTDGDMSFTTNLADYNSASGDGWFDLKTILGPTANRAEVRFYTADASSAEDDTFYCTLYALREGHGELMPICNIAAGTQGTHHILNDPVTGSALAAGAYWIDDLATVTDYWPTGVTVVDATDRIASLAFDAAGYRFIHSRVYNAAGTASEVHTLGIIISGF